MSGNFWIRIIGLIYGYISQSIRNIAILSGIVTAKKETENYTIAHTLISEWPKSFAHKPSGIKIGRALFVPFILIAQIYDQTSKIKK
jgi:hypothetical protein